MKGSAAAPRRTRLRTRLKVEVEGEVEGAAVPRRTRLRAGGRGCAAQDEVEDGRGCAAQVEVEDGRARLRRADRERVRGWRLEGGGELWKSIAQKFRLFCWLCVN